VSKNKDKVADPPQPEDGTIADVSEEVLTARGAKIIGHLEAIDELLSDAVELTDDARSVAHRMRGQAEKEALESVLDYVDTMPAAFKGLANKDEGHDPNKFETGLLRHRLANGLTLTKLVERFDETRLALSDSALYVATLVKPPILAAYEIAKPLAKNDEKNGKNLNPATNYFGAVARAGAKTRKAKAQAKRDSEDKK
jgi:hypothetical protein